MEKHLRDLEVGPAHRFSGGINREIPRVAAGAYSIWEGDRLIYVGHAGRAAATTKGPRSTGLADRLCHHGSGKRSGDKFCVYLADRIVLGRLAPSDLAQIERGELLIDDFLYVYVQDRLSYRITITRDVASARTVEEAARSGRLAAGKPFLNPLPAPKRPPRKRRAADIRERGI